MKSTSIFLRESVLEKRRKGQRTTKGIETVIWHVPMKLWKKNHQFKCFKKPSETSHMVYGLYSFHRKIFTSIWVSS